MAAKKSNTVTLIAMLALTLGMLLLAYASVPLYQMFCRVTGYGGTTKVVPKHSDRIVDRTVRIRFNSDADPLMRWHFKPLQEEMTLKLGETGIAFFTVTNLNPRSLVGVATYNVTPLKVGNYFNKIECFCFTDQIVAPGQERIMPVTFFISPDLAEDSAMSDIDTITLSYTFFKSNHQVSKEGDLLTSRALHKGNFYK